MTWKDPERVEYTMATEMATSMSPLAKGELSERRYPRIRSSSTRKEESEGIGQVQDLKRVAKRSAILGKAEIGLRFRPACELE